MIESKPGGPLYTWRCPYIPTEIAVTPATRLPNHRPIYLDYEGPVSGGRGRVTRVAGGRCLFFRRDFRSFLFVPDNARYAQYLVGPVWARPLAANAPPQLWWAIEGSGEQRGPDDAWPTEPRRP
ncbi:MAG TPA: hypothetical protein VEA69_23500 [Tepidisphaeraceae bacterium]|nr:hypothetical protein [Tepidisphaeraceae bacterium]